MQAQLAVIPFSIGTGAAGTTVPVTVGFEVQAAILVVSGRTETTNAAGSATHLRGIGFIRQHLGTILTKCVASRDGDGVGTAVAASGHRTDACIAEIDSTDAFVGWAGVQSISSTQVVFEILDQFVTNLRVVGYFIGGVKEVGIATVTASGSSQNVQLGMTDRPDMLFVMGAGTTAAAPSTVVDSTLSFGVCNIVPGAGDVVDMQAVLCAGANDAATVGATGSYALGGEVYAMMNNPVNSPTNRGQIGSVQFNGTSGFWEAVVAWPERAQANIFHVLAIAGGEWSIDEILTQTDTTTDIVISGKLFKPIGGLVFSACKAETVADAAPAAHDEWSIGAFTTASNRFAQQVSSRNGNTTMFVQTAYRTDAVYVNQDPATDAIEGLMDVKSMNSDGVTFIMDDADPSQAWATVVLLGNKPTAPPFLPKPLRFSPRRRIM